MSKFSQILLATAAVATLSACSSELSEDEQAILDARMEEEAKPTNLTAVIQEKPELSMSSTLVGLSGVGAELESEGPFTAFTANNAAYDAMEREQLDELMSPDNKEELAAIAKYGLVDGTLSSADVAKAIADGDGTASLTTLQGGTLKATMDGDKIVLEDAAGNMINIVEADVESSNGVIHVVDKVLMPK